MSNPIFEQIQKDISENDVVLYMKGTKQIPQCGFSATVAQVLSRLGIENYKDVNVLADAAIRDGIKEFSDWPTIPQLYVKGEFVGGCDIVREMYESGELQELIKEKNVALSSVA
ncbi:MAG: Grx4 family monothiol glutaredoxin [Rickettsiales bacterium]